MARRLTRRRLVLLHDGTVVGCFEVREHETHVLVLEPNGHSYSYVGPSGVTTRHLTPTFLSMHRELLTASVHFRNQFAWCARRSSSCTLPYLCESLVHPTSLAGRRHNPASSSTVCWPSQRHYSSRALWRDDVKMYEIVSIEGSATVRLHASGKIAHVCYRVRVTEGDRNTELVEQTFPLSYVPECFSFAVHILRAARRARESGLDVFELFNLDGGGSATGVLPPNGASSAQPTFRPLRTEVTSSARHDPTSPHTGIDVLSRWIRGMSQALTPQVAVECVYDAVYIVEQGEAPCVLFYRADPVGCPIPQYRLVECERSFFILHDQDGRIEQQFTSDTIPLALESIGTGYESSTTLLQYAAHLCRRASMPPQEPTMRVEDDHNSSDQDISVIEDVENGDGRFRAFSNGIVRAVFHDRTILHLNSVTSHWVVTDSYGTRTEFTADCVPSTVSAYVACVEDFASWAFATPEERYRRHCERQEQQHMVSRELHRIAVRQQLNHRDRIGNSSVSKVKLEDATYDTSARTHSPTIDSTAISRLLQETQRHLEHVQSLLNVDTP